VSQPTTVTDAHRRAVADAYEAGWDDALDLARETLRGATDITSALVRMEVLATSRRVGPGRGHEPGA
jgi:hypothetical protein